MQKVVHCKKEKYDVYIGRKKNTIEHFGNPFSHKNETLAEITLTSRGDCVNEFKEWLIGNSWHNVEPDRRKWVLENLHLLKGKTLGCWCKPKSCHGDVLIELLNKSK